MGFGILYSALRAARPPHGAAAAAAFDPTSVSLSGVMYRCRSHWSQVARVVPGRPRPHGRLGPRPLLAFSLVSLFRKP